MSQITVSQAAEQCGLSTSLIRRLIRQGRIKAESYGKTWVLDGNSLAAYIQNRRAPGRPKKVQV